MIYSQKPTTGDQENIFIDVPGCSPKHVRYYPNKINFKDVRRRAEEFANVIEKNFKKIQPILLRYESYEVVKDETARSLDLLRSLSENENFFKREIGSVATFLPRNQPLYAFCCFCVVPALMSKEVHVKPPTAVHFFFYDLMEAMEVSRYFPNIFVSSETREEFLRQRAAVSLFEETGETVPFTDVVIFTGTMENADRVRKIFDTDTLFIANGAGHNPIVISDDAKLEKAVQSVLRIQLYNQGQDCANANSILIHSKITDKFLNLIRKEIKKQKVGPYMDTKNRVGPLSEIKALIGVQEILVENERWIDSSTPGIIRTKEGIVEPTIIAKPLEQGGNFDETFAPIFFVQEYENDSDLKDYFEDPRYSRNAMYVTLFGSSKYVDSLVQKRFGDNKLLHTKSTIITNTDLHAPGIERGTQCYGGFGRGASCYSLYGKVTAKPTLPQRDIFENLVEPNLKNKSPERKGKVQILYKAAVYQKASPESVTEVLATENEALIDISSAEKGTPFMKLDPRKLFSFLPKPNYQYAKQLSEEERKELKKFVEVCKKNLNLEALEAEIFAIAKPLLSKTIYKSDKGNFFKNVYQLIIGRDFGPRMAKLVFFSDRKKIVSLIEGVLEKSN